MTPEQKLAALDDFARESLMSPPSYTGNTEGWADGAEDGWRHAMGEVRKKIGALWPEIHDWTVEQEPASHPSLGPRADA